MIRLDTFRALLEHRHDLACYCPGCRRWASTDLAGIVALGLGDRPISDCRPLCRVCGHRGEWQVRPPLPKFEGATWMAN
ncbi:MAG: hypothetical protein QG616_660 [Pseudomonadota bacterium]|nr:hypothetical protein [Pseudomonadota bacterium]